MNLLSYLLTYMNVVVCFVDDIPIGPDKYSLEKVLSSLTGER